MQNSTSQPFFGPANAPPSLGPQVPGVNSELPAKPGLSPYTNPVAQQLQSYGRNGDTMLVHMTPGEVSGLQQLAMAHGGSLTINPHTGLPEANFLKKLLPTILGVALNFIPGVGPLMSAALVGAGYTAATGSLKKGLMAGLQAYGGAGIGAGLSKLGTAAASAALPTAGSAAANTGLAAVKNTLMNNLGAQSGLAPFGQAAQAVAGEGVKQAATEVGKQTIGQAIKSNAVNAGSGLKALANTAMSNPIQAVKDFGGGFSGAVKADPWIKNAPFLQKVAPFVAGQGAFSGVTSAMQPEMPTYSAPEESKWTYDGPYVMPPREVSYPGADEEGSGEHLYFTPSNPVPGYRSIKSLSPEERKRYGYAEGGVAALPASKEFKDLVAFYNTGRPGPITASIKPVKPEKTTPATPATSTTSTTSTTPAVTYTGDPTSVSVLTTAPGIDDYIKNVQGGKSTNRVTADGIDLVQLMRDRPDVYKAFFTEYNNPKANDKNSTAWMNRVGGTDPFAYANYWYNTHGKNEGYTQRPTTTATPMDVETDNTQIGRYGTYTPGEGWWSGGSDFSNLRLMASGGSINMDNGSFVVDARTVSELGNGSSNAGIEHLQKMGGQPIRGPGDGVSDSIPASIGGRQPARVARDEVIFPPQAVRRLGGGNEQRGTQKLYAMMDKAHAARKRAGRGTDTKLRRGLA